MQIIGIMLPVVLLVLVGVFFRKIKILGDNALVGLNAFLFNASIPALIFVTLSTAAISELMDYRFIIGYTITVMFIYFGTTFVFHRLWKKPAADSYLAGFCAAISNSGLIALPILIGIVGHKASIPVAITFFIVLLIMMPIMTFSIELKRNNNIHGIKLVANAIKNTILHPFVLASIIGVLFAILKIHLPAPIMSFFDYLSQTTVGVALLVIGVGLTDVKLKGQVAEIVSVTLINVLLKPLIAVVMAKLLGLSYFWAVSLLVCCAVPTAKSAFVIAKKYTVFVEETAGVIFLGTVLTVITLPIWLLLVMHLWQH